MIWLPKNSKIEKDLVIVQSKKHDNDDFSSTLTFSLLISDRPEVQASLIQGIHQIVRILQRKKSSETVKEFKYF
jgi:hypothetical protein